MFFDYIKNKKEIVDYSKKIYNLGLSPGLSGNISIRQKSKILISGSGTCLGDLNKNNIATLDIEGNVLNKKIKPSSEKKMHLSIYQQRSDINAIIHCHSPYINAFAVANKDIEDMILPDFALIFGKIKSVPFFSPSSIELANSVKEIFKTDNCALLFNHGVIIGANTLKLAYYNLELLNSIAKTYIFSKLLGNINCLTKEQIENVKKLYT